MKKLALFLTLAAAGVMAETSTESAVSETGTSNIISAVPTEEKINGTIEVRPSWTSNSGEFHTENTLGAGYQFNRNFDLGYTQYIDTNLFNPGTTVSGLGPIVRDGFLNANFKNLYNNGQGFSVSYEPRVYLPTATAKRDAGMVTMLRNNFTVRQSFSPLFALTAQAIPMIHAYSQAGAAGKANPVFEQRFYLVGEFQFTDKLSAVVPLMLESTRHANYATGAKNNNAWSHKLYMYPELYYAIDSNYLLGVAYMTGDFTDPNLSGFALSKGFKYGVPQLILRASL